MKLIITILSLLFCLNSTSQIKMQDDAKHFYGGAIIDFATGCVVYNLTKNKTISIVSGFAAATTCGILKEYVWDRKMGRGTFNKQDIYTTMWGGTISSMILVIHLNIKSEKERRLQERKDQMRFLYNW